jgi:PD-(D/E)XK nuclease superfamily protein
MLALRNAGYSVLLPFGENTRYDLVIDDGATLARVQCKTGRLRSGSVRFATCSSYAHHPNPAETNRHYMGEIDFFGVHCPQTGGVFLIPIQDIPTKRTASLRVEATRNSQRKRIRMAADYEICKVALSGALRASAGA